MEYRKLSDLVKLKNNPRIIIAEDMQKLKESIKKFGVLEARPLILSNRTGELVIIGGNMRYEACKDLKITEVPTQLMEGLTEADEREIIIRDNISNWDWDMSALANEWSDDALSDWWVVWAEWLGQETVTSNAEEWKNMPAFDQADLTPVRQIIVSFATPGDVEMFAHLMGQTLTDKTKSIWYPEVKNTSFIDKKYDTDQPE
jgi:hypothetical protein